MSLRQISVLALCGSLGLLLLGVLWAQQQKPATSQPNTKLIPSVKGADLFRAHCAACHGAEGKGNGPAAPALKMKPTDLTMIAARNHGEFPGARLQRVIAGDKAVVAHGSSEMPVWGPVFHQVERDQDWGEVRLHNLVQYLASIQKK